MLQKLAFLGSKIAFTITFISTVACQSETRSGAELSSTSPQQTIRIQLLPLPNQSATSVQCHRGADSPPTKLEFVYQYVGTAETVLSGELVTILGRYDIAEGGPKLLPFATPCQIKRDSVEIFRLGSASAPKATLQSLETQRKSSLLTANKWTIITLDLTNFGQGKVLWDLVKESLSDPVLTKLNTQGMTVSEQLDSINQFRARLKVRSGELCLLPPGASLQLSKTQTEHKNGNFHFKWFERVSPSSSLYVKLPVGLDSELTEVLGCESESGWVDMSAFD